MAELLFSDTALLHIRALMATQPLVDPVVAVGWWKGTVENSRSPDGAVLWRTVEAARWYAHVSDWGDFPESASRDQMLEQMHGFSVYRDQRAQTEPGVLSVTLTESGLAVEHSAA